MPAQVAHNEHPESKHHSSKDKDNKESSQEEKEQEARKAAHDKVPKPEDEGQQGIGGSRSTTRTWRPSTSWELETMPSQNPPRAQDDCTVTQPPPTFQPSAVHSGQFTISSLGNRTKLFNISYRFVPARRLAAHSSAPRWPDRPCLQNSGTGHSDGFGLSKIELFHPEVLSDLQGLERDVGDKGKARPNQSQIRLA